jgi:hypothetical protein
MKLMRAIGKVHVEDPAMVKSTDPEQEGQESCGRSPSDEIRGRSKRRVVVSTRIVQSLSRTDERRGLDENTDLGRWSLNENGGFGRSRSQSTKKRVAGGMPPFLPQLSFSEAEMADGKGVGSNADNCGTQRGPQK